MTITSLSIQRVDVDLTFSLKKVGMPISLLLLLRVGDLGIWGVWDFGDLGIWRMSAQNPKFPNRQNPQIPQSPDPLFISVKVESGKGNIIRNNKTVHFV